MLDVRAGTSVGGGIGQYLILLLLYWFFENSLFPAFSTVIQRQLDFRGDLATAEEAMVTLVTSLLY